MGLQTIEWECEMGVECMTVLLSVWDDRSAEGRDRQTVRHLYICVCPGVYPGYGVLPPELAHDHAAAAAAAAASMSHLAGLGSLSPGGLAYARAAMVCLSCCRSFFLSYCKHTVSNCGCSRLVGVTVLVAFCGCIPCFKKNIHSYYWL